jgi:hypothetical protein
MIGVGMTGMKKEAAPRYSAASPLALHDGRPRDTSVSNITRLARGIIVSWLKNSTFFARLCANHHVAVRQRRAIPQ